MDVALMERTALISLVAMQCCSLEMQRRETRWSLQRGNRFRKLLPLGFPRSMGTLAGIPCMRSLRLHQII